MIQFAFSMFAFQDNPFLSLFNNHNQSADEQTELYTTILFTTEASHQRTTCFGLNQQSSCRHACILINRTTGSNVDLPNLVKGCDGKLLEYPELEEVIVSVITAACSFPVVTIV